MTLSPKRVGRITGSRAGAILGLSPFSSQSDVLREMVRQYHGAESEFKGNIATEYGQQHESMAIFAYEMETGTKVQSSHFYEYGTWLGATPDGHLDEETNIEVKCPFSLRNGGVYKSIEDQPHYYAQVQIEMFCSRRTMTHFAQWSPKLPLNIQIVPINGRWLEENIPKLVDFHDLYLSELNNPEHLAPLRKELTKLEHLQLAEEYADLKDAIDRSQERQKEILAELVEASGGKNAQVGELKLTVVERKGAVAYAKVVKKFLPDVDLTKYTGKPTSYWTLK